MNRAPKEAKVPRKPHLVDVDESIWRATKAAAAIKGMTLIEAFEEALAEWLAE